MAMLDRLRFAADLAPLAGVSFGVSGAGAASSRARALVDRRGSDIVCSGVLSLFHRIMYISKTAIVRGMSVLESDARDGRPTRRTSSNTVRRKSALCFFRYTLLINVVLHKLKRLLYCR
jgi:hypothetical protein